MVFRVKNDDPQYEDGPDIEFKYHDPDAWLGRIPPSVENWDELDAVAQALMDVIVAQNLITRAIYYTDIARPDGSFATDDDVAAAYAVREQAINDLVGSPAVMDQMVKDAARSWQQYAQEHQEDLQEDLRRDRLRRT